ncbi:hypothetical protein [Foetidibacter luteolus]|uniref:hypothetical protein n=1 Tax=Foetidibacter luteolus TaxID=2608880 RepID=UPI00129BBAB0|nr:hypothetical protein [Foetidibacter luteolus]
MKTYLLLRNNKESGPYTAEELIKAGLKAYDLVWIEGRSTAWRYPSEVDELKAYAPAVEEQPFDRFYKKKNDAANASPALPDIPKKEKPRFRIAAAWKKLDATPVPQPVLAETTTPVETKQAAAAVAQATVAPSWKEVYSEWKTTPATTPETVKPTHSTKDAARLETKYSQSLDEIKERYVESVLKPRAQRGFSLDINAKQIGEGLLIVLVIAFGLWMVFKPGDSKADENATVVAEKTAPPKEQPKPVQEQEVTSGEEENLPLQQSSNMTVESATVTEPETNRGANVISFDKPAQQKKQASAAPAVTKNNLPARYVSDETANVPANVSTQPTAGVRNTVRRNTATVPAETVLGKNAVIKETSTDVQKQAVANTPPTFKSASFKSVDQLVKVDQLNRPSGIVQDVKLNLQNMTNSVLDLVVVDLQYFDKKGFYKKGETLYIKNVPANRDVIIKTPDDLSAANLTYKVSLISSEQKGLYVVAD